MMSKKELWTIYHLAALESGGGGGLNLFIVEKRERDMYARADIY